MGLQLMRMMWRVIPNYTLWSDEVNLVKSGVLTAPHQGGINLSVGWKGLRLSGSFTYQFGGVNRLSGIYGSNSRSVFDPCRMCRKSMQIVGVNQVMKPKQTSLCCIIVGYFLPYL